MRDAGTALLLLTGTALFVSAGIGLLRFPSPYARIHAAGKATTLGFVCLVTAGIFQLTELRHATSLVVVAVFQLATTPVGAHVVARAAFRRRIPLSTPNAVDELAGADDES